MKVFITADMEGITGVVAREQLMPESKPYRDACRLYTADINAAILGVLDREPSATFVVNDGHGIMRNIVLEELHDSAELVIGGASHLNKPLCQCEGIDDSFDLGFLVGFHSRSGSGGLLAHTLIGSTICNFRINDKIVGEVGINAAVHGSFGVPIGLVTGNDELEPEARDTIEGDFAFASTKRTLGPTAAICKTPAATHKIIRAAASEAVERLKRGTLKLTEPMLPITMDVETYRRESVDRALLVPGVERTGERSFCYSAESIDECYRAIWTALTRTQDQDAPWLS